MIVRIATRQSPLALWQAHHVADLLTGVDPSVEIEIISTETFADRDLSVPIAELGGKGAFSKEIQQLVLLGQADIAVHSAKDLQAETPDGLVLAAFPERGDDRDALIGCSLAQLPIGATVATGSNRRRVQLQHLRPDLEFVGLRGNIQTRLGQLNAPPVDGAQVMDAIVMANAALSRLGIEPGNVDVLDPSLMIPQVGQGALAVECRNDDHELRKRLASIDHGPSRCRVEAERGFLVELGGDCDLPAGAHAQLLDGGSLRLRAVLASEDETRLERVTLEVGHPLEGDIAELGAEAARQLRSRLDLP